MTGVITDVNGRHSVGFECCISDEVAIDVEGMMSAYSTR